METMPDSPILLTDPFLMAPRRRSVQVIWFTETAGTHDLALVGPDARRLTERDVRAILRGNAIPGVRAFSATTSILTQTAEDADSNLPEGRRPSVLTPRRVLRHEATVSGLVPGRRIPYRVASVRGREVALSDTFTLAPAPRRGAPVRIMFTSDHQDKPNTPRNLEMAARTLGRVDAVLHAGDLANVPDRASEWFDSLSGSSVFPALQGRAHRADTAGNLSTGGAIIQHAPIWPAIGNHEVMGRGEGAASLNDAFHAQVPRRVAEAECQRLAVDHGPTVDHAVGKDEWIVRNSYNTTTYEQIFASLPATSPGGVRYYATTIGNVRLITLDVTRAWRGTEATADPLARTSNSRHHDAAGTQDDPFARGYGEFGYEPIGVGSAQHEWLVDELSSAARAACEYTIVMLHEGPHGLGENMAPPFAEPVEVPEFDDAGARIGARYEYDGRKNVLVHELAPLLEDAGVQLVLNAHSHLWNRFVARNGRTNYLEASNTGNSYGAYHPASGMSRPVPGEPWVAEGYLAQGNPGGLEPVRPSEGGLNPDDCFVASNDHVVFQCFDSGTGEVTSRIHDVRRAHEEPRMLDRFTLQR